MATFSTLNETVDSTSSDYVLLRQGSVDYKTSRENLAIGLANARWVSTANFSIGSETIGSDGEKYVALVATGPDNGDGVNPTTDDGTNWLLVPRDVNNRWTDAVDYEIGSECIGSDNEKYYALVATGPNKTLTYDPTLDTNNDYWSKVGRDLLTAAIAPNKIKTSQLVVTGRTGDALPENGTTTSYADGNEIAYGWKAYSSVTNLTKDTYGNVILDDTSSDVGVLYYEVALGENQTIDDLYGSVMQYDGTEYEHIYATDDNGITLSEVTTGYARLAIDLTVLTEGFVAASISEQQGLIEILDKDIIAERCTYTTDAGTRNITFTADIEGDTNFTDDVSVEGNTTVDGNVTVAGSSTVGGYDVLTNLGASLSSDGYQKFSSGLILQWGSEDNATTVTLPTSFTTACLQAVATRSEAVTNGSNIQVTALSTTTITVTSEDGYTGGFRWFAIGY